MPWTGSAGGHGNQAPPPVDSSRAGRARWRRLTRSPRGAAGLGILAAALLLWPFSGWSPWPWLAGLGTLVLLRLLRLDGLMRGWVLHLAGLAVVAWLVSVTGFWAWVLAMSIGLLLAGLMQLPEWRVAAVGAVLCLAAGTGYVISSVETAQAQARLEQERNVRGATLAGERSAERVLPALLEGISQTGAEGDVCRLLDERAEAQFVRAAGAADCPAAVAAFRPVLGPAPELRDLDAPVTGSGGAMVTDACRTAWARPGLGGRELGRIDVRFTGPPGDTFYIAGFRPC